VVHWLKSLPGAIATYLVITLIVSVGTGLLGIKLPLWAAIVAVAMIAPVAFASGRLSARGRDLRDYYAEHVRETLETLQKAIAGGIPGVSYQDFIERGILEPARHWLRQAPHEDVRLSVLVPDDADRDFSMLFAAGHTIEARQKFRLEIAGSFAGLAYKRGATQRTGDVDSDDRWHQHPHAHRPYGSLISVPIKVNDEVVGVFNVLSTIKHAFSPGDLSYIELLGGVVNLAWSLAASHAEGDGNGGEPAVGSGNGGGLPAPSGAGTGSEPPGQG
jgi:GAF domain